MEIEEQVCSLESAKRMKELGFPQKAYWSWYTNADNAELIHNPNGYRGMEVKTFDAYTVAETGEMLPNFVSEKDFIRFYKHYDKWVCYLEDRDGYRKIGRGFVNNKEAEVRAKMLIYLAENSFINPKKL